MGSSRTLANTEGNDLTVLGTVNGTTYVHVPDSITPPEQPTEIAFKESTITPEVKEELKKQRFVAVKKQLLRESLENEIGDTHDMIADCMKLIEFNIMLTSRLAADYFGTEPMSETTKSTYGQRNQQFLDGVDSGAIKLRGDLDDINDMFQRLMVRYTRTQELINEKYIQELNRVGL